MPNLFAKDVARRNHQPPPVVQPPPNSQIPSLKRDRPEETIPDLSHKRRNTSEGRPMMPPSTPSLTSLSSPTAPPLNNQFISNLSSAHPSTPQQPPMSSPMRPPSSTPHPMPDMTPSRRPPQQQQQPPPNRQMSPPQFIPRSSTPSQRPPQMSNNALAGPSNPNAAHVASFAASLGMTPEAARNGMAQAYAILQNPNHPVIAHMNRTVQGFSSMPMQLQMQKMMAAQVSLLCNASTQKPSHGSLSQATSVRQREQAQQQQAGAQMGGMPNSAASGNMQHTSPTQNFGGVPSSQTVESPSAPSTMLSQMPHQMNPSNPGFSGGNIAQGSVDPRTLGSMNPGGFPPGVTVANLTPQQRQLLLMQQQARGGQQMGGMGGPQQPPQPGGLQRHLSSAGSPTISTSSPGPILGGESNPFAHMRPDSAGVPGIARTARSPSEGAGGATSPVGSVPPGPRRQASMGQEEFQRSMMMQAAQAQAQAQAGSIPRPVSSASFGHGQPSMGMGNSAGWQQQGQGMGGMTSAQGMSAGQVMGGSQGMNVHGMSGQGMGGGQGMGAMGMGASYGMPGGSGGGGGINPSRIQASYSNSFSPQGWQQPQSQPQQQHPPPPQHRRPSPPNPMQHQGGGMGGGQFGGFGGAGDISGMGMGGPGGMSGMGTPRMMAAAPQSQPQQMAGMGMPMSNLNVGMGDGGGLDDFDVFNWGAQ